MHSHLIPGIDDGVKDLEESISMIAALHELGYKKLITTPHIMGDFFRNTPDIIRRGLDRVRSEVERAGIPVTLEAAAEYYIDEDFLRKLYDEKLLTFGDQYLLFEVSYINAPENLLNVVFEMITRGYKPVLAHPERYPFWYDRFEEYHRLREAGVLFQLNLNSLCEYYGVAAKNIAERMINENMIDLAGTDLHGQRHLDALRKTIAEKRFHHLAYLGVKNSSL